MFYVTNKWIGGLLTNFPEVSKNFKKLTDLAHKLNTPSEQEGYTKKEVGLWAKAKEKLEGFYGGVYSMTKKPDALFIIDSHLEDLAVSEAMKMGITTVAITDTNSDPSLVDYPIPANDDAVGSLQLIISYILDAWVEGRNASAQNEKLKIKSQKEGTKETINRSNVEEKAKASREAKPKTKSKTKKA
ncbi:MAG: 30S ribosomal protein S2 [Candidatus Levybacteria bacterium]|nr:30S ribosomal protein S2 [Candidatus Levybacteria bacterium]